MTEEVAPAPAPAPKPTLLQMILFVESEIEGLRVWEEVWRREGGTLLPGQAHRLRYLMQIHKVLELLKLHDRQFTALIKEERRRTVEANEAAAGSRRKQEPKAAALPPPVEEPVPEVEDTED